MALSTNMRMKTQNWLLFLRNPQTIIIYLRNMCIGHVSISTRNKISWRFHNIASYSISPSCTPHIPSAHHAHPSTPAFRTPQSNPSSVNPALVIPRNCDNSADNRCYICGGDVCKAKKGQHRDSEKGVSFAFRMQDRRPKQIQDPAHMLP
jgi:hypothetical protein